MIKRKFISVILIMTIVLSLFSAVTLAEEAIPVWDGSVASGFESGSGTEWDPYIIKTAPQLAYLAQSVNSGATYCGKYICLISDIVLNTADMFKVDENGAIIAASSNKPPRQWTKIGNFQADYYFGGSFDGNNHEIRGIYIDSLFGYCYNATIKNIGVTDGFLSSCGAIEYNYAESGTSLVSNCYNACTIKGAQCGGIIGSSYASSATITYENCYNSGNVSGNTGGDFYSRYAGGIIGSLANTCGWTDIINCHNFGEIISSKNAGGICASISSYGFRQYSFGDTIIENCSNCGSVTGSIDDYYFGAGGIVGYSQIINGQASLQIFKCYNTGNIYGASGGGIIGSGNISFQDTRLNIANCYNAGDINSSYSGGISGICFLYQDSIDDSANMYQRNCYNIGKVYGNIKGGLVGFYANGDFEEITPLVFDCYYLDKCVDLPNDHGTQLTDVQMQEQASFVNFNFGTVWTMEGNPDYPYPELVGMYHGGEAGSGVEAKLNAEFTETDTSVTVALTAENIPDKAEVYVVTYDAFGSVKSLKVASFTDNAAAVNVAKADASRIKLFALDIIDLFPYTESELYIIME